MAIKLGPLEERAEAEAKSHPGRLKFILIGAVLVVMLVAGAGAGLLESIQGDAAQAQCHTTSTC